MGKRKNSAAAATEAGSRKARRKEKRQLKKKKRAIAHSHHVEEDTSSNDQHRRSRSLSRSRSESGENFDKSAKKSSKGNKKRENSSDIDTPADPYAHLDPMVAAALRADDAEINDLESRLGVAGTGTSSAEDRKRLNKEYAKLESYGDDFGEFLFGLDDMVGRLGESGGNNGQGDESGSNEGEDYAVPDNFEQSDEESDAEPPQVSKKKDKKEKKEKKSKREKKSSSDGPYDNVDAETAAALRADDEEIAALEEKLHLKSGKKERKKLNKEYARLEGYGDDFGEFLFGLDDMVGRLKSGKGGSSDDSEEEGQYRYNSEDDDAMRGIRDEYDSASASSEDEEVVPMKEPAASDEEKDFDGEFHAKLAFKGQEENSSDNDDVMGSRSGADASDDEDEKDDHSKPDDVSNDNSDDDDSNDNSDESSADEEDPANVPDHDAKFTYRPSSGEDIYGNRTDDGKDFGNKPTKYVPPHLRKKMAAEEKNDKEKMATAIEEADMGDNDPDREESMRIIRRLNNVLNRLSDQMLESVSKSIAGLYRSYPTHDVNECFLSNIKNACVPPHLIMSGLIPIYIACASGVHFQTGDDVQLGGCLLEHVVLDTLEELGQARKGADSGNHNDGGDNEDPGEDDDVISNKRASNLVLILCYLYNYGVVHCSLMYDIIRELIEHFSEMDVKVLLLILSHCGYQLRSDDPTALKDIVFLVQDRALRALESESDGGESVSVASSSRVQYMISAMTDLKNNKRRKKDEALGQKTAAYKKIIGRIKSAAASSIGRSTDASMRIRLQDIKDIETKGRWWKVGAKWRGNQFHDGSGDGAEDTADVKNNPTISRKQSAAEREEDALLVMASKYRMNTDLRRSIFCIIMGSTDCEDAFEKLVRGGMLKGKAERDVIRVLTECCLQEKSYNPYYAHLANRICEYQPSCNFTFRLTYWDAFKQFDSMKTRKAANLAKLLAHLLADGRGLNLNILKVIDIDSSGMPENAIIFLMVLFTTLFESFEDPLQVKHIFESALSRKQKKNTGDNEDDLVDDDEDALKKSLSLFLLQYLKSSPKNVKKSKFRVNFKTAVKACEIDDLDKMV